MITFDALTLKAFVKENGNFFVDSRIQKIQQPTRRDFIIYIRKSGESRKYKSAASSYLFYVKRK